MSAGRKGVRSLLVTQTVPCPPRSGVELRALSTIGALRALGPVAVFAVRPGVPPPTGGDGILWTTSSDGALAGARAHARRSLAALRDPDGHPWDRWYSPRAGRELGGLADAFRPDVVVLDHLAQARYVEHVERPGRLIVLNAHNVEGALHRELAAAEGAWDLPPGLAGRLASRLEQREREAVRAAGQTWVPSARDAALMVERYGRETDVAVVPNGVSVGRYAGEPAPDPGLMVYPALFEYPPNLLAARRLVERVLPRVRLSVPAARLALVGGGLPGELARAPGVEAPGLVPDILPHLRRASVMPVALEHGGGVRVKVLEAFASRVPVVSTAKGVEGLDVADGREVLLAETDDELADGVCRVWADDALRASLAECAHALVTRRYGQDAVTAAVAEALARAGVLPA